MKKEKQERVGQKERKRKRKRKWKKRKKGNGRLGIGTWDRGSAYFSDSCHHSLSLSSSFSDEMGPAEVERVGIKSS